MERVLKVTTIMPILAPIVSTTLVANSGVRYPNVGYVYYIVASPNHARRLFTRHDMVHVREACIEIATESKGACIVKLIAHLRGGRYEVRRVNNPTDVVEHEYAPCVDGSHELGQVHSTAVGVDTGSAQP